MAESGEMPRFNFAASRRVNPLGATPTLSAAEVWKGLEMKARDPGDFYRGISLCDVLEDKGNEVVRSVVLSDGTSVVEEIKLYDETIVYYELPSSATRMTSILSHDERGELVLTATFAGGLPGFRALHGSVPDPQELNTFVGAYLDMVVGRMRELVVQKKLQPD